MWFPTLNWVKLEPTEEVMVVTQQVFLERAKKVHGTRYTYNFTGYVGTRGFVGVCCPVHGFFQQNAFKHLKGSGCFSCGIGKTTDQTRMTRSTFLKKAEEVHGAKYDYSRVVYISTHKKIWIACPDHGPFEQTPASHLRGRGCVRCKRPGHARTQEEFIRDAQAKHGDVYDYSESKYVAYTSKLSIICKEHGPFLQAPVHHLRGSGCQVCAYEVTGNALIKGVEDFTSAASAVHSTAYDYSNVVYLGARVDVQISCPKEGHGVFWQTPDSHINQRSGCPSCQHRYSEPHKEVEEYLTSLGLAFMSNTKKLIGPLELDMYIPALNLAIEFNGTFWHALTGKELSSAKNKHLTKFLACEAKGILLLQIDEYEWEEPIRREVWKSIIASKAGAHAKLSARKTEFRTVDHKEASSFLTDNHLQGDTPAIRWAYGLFKGEEMVGVITFSMHQKTQINLSRLAFKKGLTVVGGAQKLFKNAVAALPTQDIITFSANQYSNGAIYGVLGFTKDADLPPSYQWFYQNRIWNKRHMRRASLKEMFQDTYSEDLTEHEIMYRNGGRCLYDAGYQRWIYRNAAVASEPLLLAAD